jgi:uncharacterized protein
LVSAGLFYLGGVLVFVLGSPYHRTYPTNWSWTYYLALTAFFLVLTLVFKRVSFLKRFSPAAYAFLIAAGALLFLKSGVLDIPRNETNPMKFLALDKLSQFTHVVTAILVLTLLGGDDLRSIFIKKGNLKYGLTFGLISFVGFAVLGVIIQWGSKDVFGNLPGALPWLLLFVFANATMEELWFRGIFLRKYEALIGRQAAILVTALVFGTSHVFATYDFPGGRWLFGAVVFGLGLLGAQAMFKEDGLVGPVLFHAGYDLTIMFSILNSL